MKAIYDSASGLLPGVRFATKDDEGQLYAMLLLLHAENGFFSLNHDKVLAGIRWATERKGGIIFVIEERSRIAASLGMCVAQDWYTDDEYLQERWNFVHPDFRRGTDYARRLLEQGKCASDWMRKDSGGKIAIPFACGINSFDRTEAKIRLYARHLACVGAYFMWGHAPAYSNKLENARAIALNEKIDRAMHAIDETNKKSRKASKYGEPGKAVPVVETILRLSRERDHV